MKIKMKIMYFTCLCLYVASFVSCGQKGPLYREAINSSQTQQQTMQKEMTQKPLKDNKEQPEEIQTKN